MFKKYTALNADKINKQYWSSIEPSKILAGHYFPGKELTNFIKAKANVLDVGCGSGKISEYLFKMGYIVTGIDINKKALKDNRERNPKIKYVEADITKKLPFENSSFDAITVPYVFVSIIDSKVARKVARELIRVLKTDGVIWLCEATYSEDYEERYKSGKERTGLNNVATSFFEEGEEKGKIKRFIHHYLGDELDLLFKPLVKVSKKEVSVVSSSSGMTVQTIVSVYKKSKEKSGF